MRQKPKSKKRSKKQTPKLTYPLVPTSFTLGGVTWKVKFRPHLPKVFGFCDPDSSTIELNVGVPSKQKSVDVVTQTFYHELLHAILFTMGELDLYDNEKFIDTFSAFLLQLLKQVKK